MKYLDDFRSPERAKALLKNIESKLTKPCVLMEVCGGQTHSIVKYGLDELLPDDITLIHGPGCPVCVTPESVLDKAIAISQLPQVILCSFGDMLRVPGTSGSLMDARQYGADVRIVYSPMDAVLLAQQNPDREVVFLAIGFETTAPLNAMAIEQAATQKLTNFSVLVSQVTVPPAIDLILSNPDNRVHGFLAAGHVCTVMGTGQYPLLAKKYRVPMAITGFEPVDILLGVDAVVAMLEEGKYGVENCYARCVRDSGNKVARACLERVFTLDDKEWRGIGVIPDSGLVLREAYAEFDAERRFPIKQTQQIISSDCISGEVLQGLKKPQQCPQFGERCTPEHPLGATMVSEEGACAAYYRYRYQSVEEAL